MRSLIFSLVALSLAACAAPGPPPSSSPMPDGGRALPPLGWLDYCRAHPADPSC